MAAARASGRQEEVTGQRPAKAPRWRPAGLPCLQAGQGARARASLRLSRSPVPPRSASRGEEEEKEGNKHAPSPSSPSGANRAPAFAGPAGDGGEEEGRKQPRGGVGGRAGPAGAVRPDASGLERPFRAPARRGRPRCLPSARGWRVFDAVIKTLAA